MEKQSAYDEIKHDLETKIARASSLSTEYEMKCFVARTFRSLNISFETAEISYGEYSKLLGRLLEYKDWTFTDLVNALEKAAYMRVRDNYIREIELHG